MPAMIPPSTVAFDSPTPSITFLRASFSSRVVGFNGTSPFVTFATFSPQDLLTTHVLAATLAFLFLAHLIRVRLLRYRRIENLQKKYGSTHAEFKDIDYKQAQSILGELFLYESPWIFLTGVNFAFLRAFGIISISAISKKARKMIDAPGLRYSDTMVLATEWILNPLDSDRATIAINRMNYIHSRYRGIRTDQTVYTLCLLVCEVFDWIDTYDWRRTTPLERYASYVFWHEVGIRMGITPCSIPKTFDDCLAFIKDFEEVELVPSEPAEEIADAVILSYTSVLPVFIRSIHKHIISSFMTPPVRRSMGIPNPNPFLESLILPALRLRAWWVRSLHLPRTYVPAVFAPNSTNSSDTLGLSSKGTPMYSVLFWQLEPWYVPATAWNLYGPSALFARAFGLPIPGPQWKSEGYKLEAIGHGGRGAETVVGAVRKAREDGGCPFSNFGSTLEPILSGKCPMANV